MPLKALTITIEYHKLKIKFLLFFPASAVGTVIAFQLGGILAHSRFEWPSTFWVTGVLCLIGLILITVFGAASPKDHKSISDDEKAYILGKVENRTETVR